MQKGMTRGRLVALLGVALLLAGCDESWTNWAETETVYPRVLVAPESAAQLTSYVSQATSRGLRVRMTGSGHSMSDVAVTTDVLMTPEKLNRPLALDRARLRNPADDSLVRVQSGMRIREINSWLEGQGRAMINLGGYDGQTIAGVMQTATHGSGLAYGPITDTVASLQVVLSGGKMVQVEPTHGITNPATFPGRLEEDRNIPVKLIQDDEAFNAMRMSVGSMGVVYAVTFRTDRKFWLREVRERIKWSELKKPGGPLARALAGQPIYGDGRPSPEHWELLYSPFPDADGDYSFLTTSRYRSYEPLPEMDFSPRGALLGPLGEELVVLFGQPLAAILDLFPALSPPVLESALDTLVSPAGGWSHKSYKVFHIGRTNDTRAMAIEAAFRLDQVVPAIERSFSVNAGLYAQGIPMSGPIAVRFVKGSSAHLAMQQGRDSMFIEVIVLRDGRNAQKLLRTHQQAYVDAFASRPHWGLDTNYLRSEAQVAALYPETWARWKTQFRRFNAAGTFDGKFTDRLGISVRPR